jgi:hypothetical protein
MSSTKKEARPASYGVGAMALAVLAPVAPGAEPDIRDIRGPISIPSVVHVLLLAGGALLIALALASATYWLVRRLRRIRVKTASELALERLERARGLARDGRAADLGEELSETIREYLQARFDLRAAYHTTEEFLHESLEAHDGVVAAHRDLLGEFLRACDLAKFARFALDVEHMQAMVDAAESFVRATAAPPPAAVVRTEVQPTVAQEART